MFSLSSLEGKFAHVEHNHNEMTITDEALHETPGYELYDQIKGHLNYLGWQYGAFSGRIPLYSRIELWLLMRRHMKRYDLSGIEVTVMEMKNGRPTFRPTLTL